jgi:hypothetical protein
MNQRIILDLCGGTGSWSAPYRDAGYDVLLVTLPDQDVRAYKAPANVHGILAAPPCTMFSLARRTAKTPPDFVEAMSVVKACLGIIWECRIMGTLKWWALENPRGLLRQFLGQPALTFTANQFGDDRLKPTDIWGYFSDPVPSALFTVVTRGPNGKPIWYETVKAGRGHGEKRELLRAQTPPGFARSFFEANP